MNEPTKNDTPRTDACRNHMVQFGQLTPDAEYALEFAGILEIELNQWKECAKELYYALNDLGEQPSGEIPTWGDDADKALIHYNQLKQGEGK